MMSGPSAIETKPVTNRRWWIGAGATVLFAVLLAYWPALHGTQVWDDDGHVTKAALRSLAGLKAIWTEVGASQQYYPILHSAFWLEHRLWGDAVLGYHLVNLVFHAGSALLVMAIMRRLALPGAWLGGLLFALHPVGVESVAWISEQKNTLSAVFYLGAALIYLDFDRTRRSSRYFAAALLFVFALLTKTVTATLPAGLLVVFWWRRGRLDFFRDVRPLLPWFALSACSGLVTAWVEKFFIGAHGADFGLTFSQRVLLAGRALWFYAGKLCWPGELVFIYPRWQLDPGAWWQWLYPCGVLVVAGCLVAYARKNRGPLAGFLFFAGTLFPALGFINVYPFIFSFVADHFQYLASLGIIVPVSAGLAAVEARAPQSLRHRAPWLAGGLLLLLGGRTWCQAGLYRDATTLYRHTLAHNPDCWLAHSNLGNILERDAAGRAEAIEHFVTALQLRPGLAEAHCGLANALSKTPGHLDEAIAHYETALRLSPGMQEAHNNLGVVLAELPGEAPRARAHFEAALRIDPGFADAHVNLGTLLSKDPAQLPAAIAHYEAALAIDPDQASTHYYLGNALAKVPGRRPEAAAQYEAALRLNPQLAGAHANLGTVYLKMKDHLSEAIAQYRAALQLDPGSADLHFNLANALAEIPERRLEAVAEYDAALRLRPDFAEAHRNLGNLLLKIPGRLDEAMAHYAAALKLHPEWESLRRLLDSLQAARL
jgi:protein O-mannosyl-transferase